MSDQTVTSESPIQWTKRVILDGWHALLTVYYANSVAWRGLKSGTLVFFGFFLWTASNLLLSVQPTWKFLNYPMAYGFILIFYGPLHHIVVIPLAVKLRKQGGLKTQIGRKLPNSGLTVFLIAVLILGTFPMSPVVFDFGSAVEGSTSSSVNPDLLCTKAVNDGQTSVHCHLSESEGIATVTVESGGETIYTDEKPPFDFTINEDQLTEITGQKQFQVVLRDEDGNMIRRYTRTLGMIEEE